MSWVFGFGISKPCRAELAPASDKVSTAVWGNSYIPNVIFGFLQLGKETERAGQVCKKLRAHADEQYNRRDRIDLNFLFVTNAQESRCHEMTRGVYRKCKNLKTVAVPLSASGNRWLCSWYFPMFEELPKTVQTLDFSAAFPHEIHHLAEKLPELPGLTRLKTCSGLSNKDIDLVTQRLPGLQELHVQGMVDLEYLFRKCQPLKQLSVIRLSTCIEQDTFIRNSTEASLATVPECPSVRQMFVTMMSAKIDDRFVQFLLRKLPNLETLILNNCKMAEGQVFLESLLKGTDGRYRNFMSLDLDGPKLADAKARVKPAKPEGEK